MKYYEIIDLVFNFVMATLMLLHSIRRKMAPNAFRTAKSTTERLVSAVAKQSWETAFLSVDGVLAIGFYTIITNDHSLIGFRYVPFICFAAQIISSFRAIKCMYTPNSL